MFISDVAHVVDVIQTSSKIDARAAKLYFDSYFASNERKEDPNELLFAAVVDERVVAVCGLSPDKYRTVGLLWLTWLYVDVEYQRRGIGRQMLLHCIECARSLHTRKICIESSSHPIYEDSIRLYEALGFRRDGYVEDYYEPGQDLILMSLAIEQSVSPNDAN